jgi:hypothetical protein
LIEPNPEHLTAVINAINNGPFFKHMSIKVTEIGVGYSVVMMRIGMRLRSILPPIGLPIVTSQKKKDWFPLILKLTFLHRFFMKKSLSTGRELKLEKPYTLPRQGCVTGVGRYWLTEHPNLWSPVTSNQ